jgi:hypothetical protein
MAGKAHQGAPFFLARASGIQNTNMALCTDSLPAPSDPVRSRNGRTSILLPLSFKIWPVDHVDNELTVGIMYTNIGVTDITLWLTP